MYRPSFQSAFVMGSLFFGLCLPGSIIADEHDGSEESFVNQGPSPVAPTTLAGSELSLLMKAFDASEPFIRQHYGQSLPAGLEQAMINRKEEGIATDIANLFGPLNDRQIQDLIDTAIQAKKDPKNANDWRFTALVDRLYYAAKLIQRTNNKQWDDYYPKFKEEFLKAWSKRKEKNKGFYSLLRDALRGTPEKSESAKRALRENYDQGAMLAFIDAQRKSGNTRLADAAARAIAFESLEGTPFIDAIDSSGNKHRIVLGSDGAQTLGRFSDAQKGLKNFQLVSQPFEGEVRRFPDNGAAVTLRPSDLPPKHEPPKEPAPQSRPRHEDQVLEAFADRCVMCHGPDGSKNARQSLKLGAEGQLEDRSPALLKRIVDSLTGANDTTLMPKMGDPLDTELQAQIRDWARSQGVTSGD